MNFPPNGFPPPNQYPPPGFPAPGFPAPAQTPYGAQTGYPAPQGFAPQTPAGYGVGYPTPQAPQGYPQGLSPGYPAALPLPASLGLDQSLRTAEEAADRFPPLPQGGHELIEVDRVYMKRSTNPESLNVIYFYADCTVLKSALVPAGTKFTFLETVVGAKYKQDEAIAAVRGFVAAAWCGIDPHSPEARTAITEQLIVGLCGPENPCKGKRAAVVSCTHKTTKEKRGRNGELLPGKLIATIKFGLAGAAVQTAPVVPMQAPAAAPVAATFPPAGWASAEPTYPGHWHNGRECITEAQLRALMAAGRA
jgi:hypothetical protein